MAARYSTCHPRCGTAFIFLVLALSIIFFAAVFPFIFPSTGEASVLRTVWGILLKIALMLPLAGLAYEVTRLAGKASAKSIWRVLLWPGLLLQRLPTSKPDEQQLEVALNALERAVATTACFFQRAGSIMVGPVGSCIINSFISILSRGPAFGSFLVPQVEHVQRL